MSGCAQQHVLDLGRVGVEAADDEHVLGRGRRCAGSPASSTTPRSPVRSQPSARERLRRRLRIVEVVGHDAAAAEEDLAGLPGRHVAAARRRRCAARSRVGVVPTVVAMVSTSSPGDVAAAVPAFGEPVAGDDVENGSSSSTRRISSTGMSAAPVTATRRVERSWRSRSGMVEDRLVERGRPRAAPSPARAATRASTPLDVEHRLGEHGGAGARRRRGCRPSARTCGSTG